MKKILGIALVTLVIGLILGSMGFPRTIVETIREVEIVKEVEIVYINNTEYLYETIYSELRDFDNVTEMKLWLEKDDIDSFVYVLEIFDCDDFACGLQANAENDGYRISVIVANIPSYTYKGDVESGYHAFNLAVIGNYFYGIEPQTDAYWIIGKLDK